MYDPFRVDEGNQATLQIRTPVGTSCARHLTSHGPSGDGASSELGHVWLRREDGFLFVLRRLVVLLEVQGRHAGRASSSSKGNATRTVHDRRKGLRGSHKGSEAKQGESHGGI